MLWTLTPPPPSGPRVFMWPLNTWTLPPPRLPCTPHNTRGSHLNSIIGKYILQRVKYREESHITTFTAHIYTLCLHRIVFYDLTQDMEDNITQPALHHMYVCPLLLQHTHTHRLTLNRSILYHRLAQHSRLTASQPNIHPSLSLKSIQVHFAVENLL